MESKFINDETLEYVKSLENATMDDQLTSVMKSQAEVIEYLGKFETYVDTLDAETEQALNKLQASFRNEIKGLVVQSQNNQNRVNKLLNRALTLSALSAAITIGMALAVWLTK